MGLLEALKQYASDAAGGSLNPEVGNTLSGLLNYGKDRAKYISGLLDDNSQINQDFQGWHKRTQLGLADLIAGREGPQADYGYSQLMNMAGVAPLGITAWHGSPHKFDKFSLDKIGTGEGAQAYGDGLYLAEAPGVAKQYADTLSSYHIATKDGVKGGGDFADALVANAGEYPSSLSSAIRSQANKIATDLANGKPAEQIVSAMRNGPYARIYSGLADAVENLSPSKAVGSLYKVDIPDEAVARFLDWDKKLSEQAPEVRDALLKQLPKDNVTVAYENPYNIQKGNFWKVYRGDNFIDAKPTEDAAREYAATIMNDAMTGGSAYGRIGGAFSGLGSHSAASDYLKQQGIPGIRYLDGGSRSAGKGSSNFVSFDPEMIRILERNGQPTGLEPWKPGEYRLGDLLK